MKYKVGDKVKVKEWDDLVAEFGTYRSGDVNSKIIFCSEMKKYCGKVVTISGITEQGNYEIAEDKDALKWVFCEDVLLPVEKDTSWEKIKKAIMQASKALATIIKNVAKSTEWRVVDRPAKAGDYIRITKINPALDYGIEKVGDIVKVTKAYDDGTMVYVLGKDFPQDREKPNDYEADYEYAFLAREFEVVELAIKQQAEPEQQKQKFEVGTYYKNKKYGYILKIVKNDDLYFEYEVVEGKDPTSIRKAHINSAYATEDIEPIEYEEEKFVPHLEDAETGDFCGKIGEPTNYKDAVERPLFVGDTVELFIDGESRGECSIVRARLTFSKNVEKTFVMGIQSDCDETKGTCGNWKIIKKRSYEDIKDGEIVNFDIRYIKTKR